MDELGQPISSGNSDDVRISETDTDRHLYGVSGSHHGSGSVRSQQSMDQQRGGGGSSSRGLCARHPITPTLSLDSQLVEQDLAYLLGPSLVGQDPQGFRRPQPQRPSLGGGANGIRLPQGPMQRYGTRNHLRALSI